MHQPHVDDLDEDILGDFERAYSVSLVACPSEDCGVHILLLDEDGAVFADAPLNRDSAAYFGAALTRIGAGEDADAVLGEGRVLDS